MQEQHTAHFNIVINEQECGIFIIAYQPAEPMVIYGPGFGDADEGCSEEFEYVVLDIDGHESKELTESMDDYDKAEIEGSIRGYVKCKQN